MEISSERKTLELELPNFVWETLDELSKGRGIDVEGFIEMIVVMKLDDLLREKQ